MVRGILRRQLHNPKHAQGRSDPVDGMRGVGDPLRAYRLPHYFNTRVELNIAYLSNFINGIVGFIGAQPATAGWVSRPVPIQDKLGAPHDAEAGETLASIFAMGNGRFGESRAATANNP
jgi:hypothetical protein